MSLCKTDTDLCFLQERRWRLSFFSFFSSSSHQDSWKTEGVDRLCPRACCCLGSLCWCGNTIDKQKLLQNKNEKNNKSMILNTIVDSGVKTLLLYRNNTHFWIIALALPGRAHALLPWKPDSARGAFCLVNLETTRLVWGIFHNCFLGCLLPQTTWEHDCFH